MKTQVYSYTPTNISNRYIQTVPQQDWKYVGWSLHIVDIMPTMQTTFLPIKSFLRKLQMPIFFIFLFF